jgi:uncharacterized protein YqjF (DUF2071 family)
MSVTKEILGQVSNRNYPLPEGKWQSYQEWHDVVMLHWRVPHKDIMALLPPGLTLDTFEGEAWVSWLGFTVKKVRYRNLPPLPAISRFEEVNLRTYVTRDGRPGIYLLSVEADKWLNVWLNRMITGIPYVRSGIKRKSGQLRLNNCIHHFKAYVTYAITEPITEKDGLDYWLTERHCLYGYENGGLFRYDIHHKEWKLNKVMASASSLRYRLGSLLLGKTFAGRKHFAKKAKVVLWKKVRILSN